MPAEVTKHDPPEVGEILRDGGHVTLSCSNCRASLVDVFVTRPSENDVWHLRATCPWCGDRSYIVEVQGGFHFGGVGRETDDESVCQMSTAIDCVEMSGRDYVIKVLKANEKAQPIYRR